MSGFFPRKVPERTQVYEKDGFTRRPFRFGRGKKIATTSPLHWKLFPKKKLTHKNSRWFKSVTFFKIKKNDPWRSPFQPTNLWCPGHWKLHHCSKRSPDFSQNCPVYETYQSSQSFPKKTTKKLGGAKNHMVKITIFTSAPLAVFISLLQGLIILYPSIDPLKTWFSSKILPGLQVKNLLGGWGEPTHPKNMVNLKLGVWKFLPQLFGGEELTTKKIFGVGHHLENLGKHEPPKNSPFRKKWHHQKKPQPRGRGTKSRRDIVLPQRCWDVNFYAQHDGVQHDEDLFVAWPKLEGWITVEASEIRGKKSLRLAV